MTVEQRRCEQFLHSNASVCPPSVGPVTWWNRPSYIHLPWASAGAKVTRSVKVQTNQIHGRTREHKLLVLSREMRVAAS